MKNNFRTLVLLCFLLSSAISFSQEINIDFKNVKWKKALKLAAKEDKLIFVDAYTTWCGPCKVLAKDVFTQPKVANYFNENFVSIKMDMEKGEGIKMKEEWDIKAYPTLLFINSEGEIMHTIVGAFGADEFLGYSKLALDENRRSYNLQQKYEAGERDPQFMYHYLVSLRLGYLKDAEAKVAMEYLESLEKADLVDPEQWNFIRDFVNDPATDAFEYIVQNRQKLYAAVGEDQVNQKLIKTYTKQLETWKYWYAEKPFETDKENKVIQFLQTTSFEEAPNLLSKLLVEKYKREEANDLYLMTMDYRIKFNLEASSSEIVAYAKGVLETFESEVAWAKALQWLNIADKKETKIEHRASILETKSKVLAKLGNKSEAELMALAAKKADQEAERAGKKIKTVPMMKMGGMQPAKKN